MIFEHLQNQQSPISAGGYGFGTWSAAGFAAATAVIANVGTLPTAVTAGSLYTHTYTHPSGGGTANYAVYVTDNRLATVQFFDDATNGLDVLNTEGTPLSGNPTGTHNYTGFNRVFKVGAASNLVMNSEDGSFSMEVDFTGNGSLASFLATTTNSSVAGTTSTFDLDEGSFTFDAVLGDNGSGNSFFEGATAGKVYGDFHGANAAGVSGVYHTDPYETGARFGGAFAGEGGPDSP